MLKKGRYILVFNRGTILSTHDDADDAILSAENHSVGCPRGLYEVFELGDPIESGRMGDRIEWKKK